MARRFQRKPGYVAYWKRKLTDPAFHPKPCGGDYNQKFDAASQLAFEVIASKLSLCPADLQLCARCHVALSVCPHALCANRMWLSRCLAPLFPEGSIMTLFATCGRVVVQTTLWAEVQHNPCRRLQDFALDLQSNYGFNVNREFIKRTFKRWRFSYKKVKYKHVLKYSMTNIRYTMRYLVFIRGPIDWTQLKFCDEASFESKSASCC